MKCISHNHIDAVWQCVTCWWWLCKDCMSNFTIAICPSCNLKYWEKRKTEILWLRKKVPLYGLGIGFLIMMLASSNMRGIDDVTYIILWLFYSIVGVVIYFWWIWINNFNNNLNKNTVTVRVNDSLVAMMIRVGFKITFAWMIGIFVWPYEIYKLRKEYKLSLSMIDMCKALISKSTHS